MYRTSQIRYPTKFISYKDMKKVYKADTRKLTLSMLNKLEETGAVNIRHLQKVTKLQTIFPTDDALFKILYLAMMDAAGKWAGKSWDWDQTLVQLCNYFEECIQQ